LDWIELKIVDPVIQCASRVLSSFRPGNALEGVDVNAEDKMESNEQVEDPEKMSKDEKLEVEEKVADALEVNFEQHDKVAKLQAPEIDENIDSEDSAMEEGSQDEKTEEVGNLQLAWETLELHQDGRLRLGAAQAGAGGGAVRRLPLS
jgi:hypothetical protein